jgi:predicted NBD/HSP70 family sugar kinase/DNA-binding MarR family transcriptional regulator
MLERLHDDCLPSCLGRTGFFGEKRLGIFTNDISCGNRYYGVSDMRRLKPAFTRQRKNRSWDRAPVANGHQPAGPGISSSRTSIIEALLENGSMSRSDLASSLGLSRSALTVLSRGLIEQGLILESSGSYDNQQTGRPSILLSLNAEHGYFIGAGLTEDPPMMVLTDLHGNSLAQHRMREAEQPRAVASAIEAGITELIRVSKISRQRVLGIGVALSGYVDHAHGICLQSNALGWRDVGIAEIIERVTKLPTYVDNDAHAVATGQKLFGHARESKNFSIVMLGKKIGEGHYINGRLHRGHTGAAGEIGHYTVVPGGTRCGCGKQGCLDVFATSTAILEKAAESGLKTESVAQLESIAATGETRAIELLRHAGAMLGVVVANSIQMNNPELVLIVDVVGFGNGFFTTSTRQAIENNILPHLIAKTHLEVHSVDKDFLARSASSIAAHQFLIDRASY